MQKNLHIQNAHYLTAFHSNDRNDSKDPLWIRELREAAISRFQTLGFPTARRNNEEWKYTNVAPIEKIAFRPTGLLMPGERNDAPLDFIKFPKSINQRMVFVDGQYSNELSSGSQLPAEVSILNIRTAIRQGSDTVRSHLAQYANYESDGFTALNTAFLHDGALIHIPNNTDLGEPILLLFFTSGKEKNIATFPRVLLLVGEKAKATIIEAYISMPGVPTLTNAVSEIAIQPDAILRHYRIQQEGKQTFHIHTTQVVQARGCTFSSFTADMGGQLTRNNLNVVMESEGSSCSVNGIYLSTGTQHIDNQVVIDHKESFTTSRELYKGIVDGKARAAFHGNIIVRKGCRKADARQINKNLLLSDQAEANTKPSFQIYADDVKCSHGATCGQLDENAIFYLRSRGIDEDQARNLLTKAFLSEVINTIELRPFRSYVEESVMKALNKL